MPKPITNEKGLIAYSSAEIEALKKNAFEEGYAKAVSDIREKEGSEKAAKKAVNKAKVKADEKTVDFRSTVSEK